MNELSRSAGATPSSRYGGAFGDFALNVAVLTIFWTLAAAPASTPQPQADPPALICALEAKGYEDFIRQAVSIGGDTDTICAIGGAVAEARFGVPKKIASETKARLDNYLLSVLDQFVGRYC